MPEAKPLSRLAWVLLLVAGCLLPLVGRAGDFETANQFYDDGKFSEAKDLYEKLVGAGGGANTYYNLGNTDYRLGSTGRAILNYERALAISPQHPEALANVRLLRQHSGARLPAAAWQDQWFASQTMNVWLTAAVLAGWVVLFSLVSLLTGQHRARGWVWLAAFLGLIVAGVGAWGVTIKWKDLSLAIITAPQTEARLAPAEVAGVAEALPAGSQVHVLSERGPWVYCELPGALRGWIPQGALEKVRPGKS